MNEWLVYLIPNRRKRKKLVICSILSCCLLLCGFWWDWWVEFVMHLAFPIDEYVNVDIIENFGDYYDTEFFGKFIVDIDGSHAELYDPIASQILTNISGDAYDQIYDQEEMEDMSEEISGKNIVQIIMDRLFK